MAPPVAKQAHRWPPSRRRHYLDGGAGRQCLHHLGAGRAAEVINDNGLANWSNASTVTSAYFRMASAGSVTLGLDARLAGSNNSTIRVTVNGTPFTVALAGTAARPMP
jgi:hypothetical protein